MRQYFEIYHRLYFLHYIMRSACPGASAVVSSFGARHVLKRDAERAKNATAASLCCAMSALRSDVVSHVSM